MLSPKIPRISSHLQKAVEWSLQLVQKMIQNISLIEPSSSGLIYLSGQELYPSKVHTSRTDQTLPNASYAMNLVHFEINYALSASMGLTSARELFMLAVDVCSDYRMEVLSASC